jgi:hypothetical protein
VVDNSKFEKKRRERKEEMEENEEHRKMQTFKDSKKRPDHVTKETACSLRESFFIFIYIFSVFLTMYNPRQ